MTETQRKYSVTELELLSIVETLKEFKGMLWGQKIKVYTDHKNLVQDALGMTSDRVYRWRLLLEEYGPEIVYIKGVDNTVADAISRLRYDPAKDANVKNLHFKECYCHMATLLSHYHVGIKTRENYIISRDYSSGRPSKNLGGETDYIKNLFTTVTGGEEEISR